MHYEVTMKEKETPKWVFTAICNPKKLQTLQFNSTKVSRYMAFKGGTQYQWFISSEDAESMDTKIASVVWTKHCVRKCFVFLHGICNVKVISQVLH